MNSSQTPNLPSSHEPDGHARLQYAEGPPARHPAIRCEGTKQECLCLAVETLCRPSATHSGPLLTLVVCPVKLHPPTHSAQNITNWAPALCEAPSSPPFRPSRPCTKKWLLRKATCLHTERPHGLAAQQGFAVPCMPLLAAGACDGHWQKLTTQKIDSLAHTPPPLAFRAINMILLPAMPQPLHPRPAPPSTLFLAPCHHPHSSFHLAALSPGGPSPSPRLSSLHSAYGCSGGAKCSPPACGDNQNEPF